MNLNQQIQGIQTPNAETEALLWTVLRRIEEIGSMQFNHLNEVEGRLHTILDHRTPIADSVKVQESESDFAQKIKREISFLEWQAERINNIRIHISEII